MDNVMTFLENNYIWLIVVGIILLFALIGYAAEKTKVASDKKEKPSKKEVEVIKEEEVPAPTTEEPASDVFTDNVEATDDISNEEAVIADDFFTDEPVIDIEEPNNEVTSFDPLEEIVEEEVSEEVVAPITDDLTFDDLNKSEDLFAPIEDFSSEEPIAEEVDVVSEIDEKLNAEVVEPETTTEEVASNQPIEDIFKIDEEDENFL